VKTTQRQEFEHGLDLRLLWRWIRISFSDVSVEIIQLRYENVSTLSKFSSLHYPLSQEGADIGGEGHASKNIFLFPFLSVTNQT